MGRTNEITIRDRVYKILKAHGPNTTFPFANKLYLSICGKNLINQTYYHYRNEYRRENKKDVPHSVSENFLTEAELEGTPSLTECLKEEAYTFSELRKVNEFAKQIGGLRALQSLTSALLELQ
jgi:hypothetical protein